MTRLVRLTLSSARNVVNLLRLFSTAECYAALRELRWSNGVYCPHCHSFNVTKEGHSAKQKEKQKYRCSDCGRHFDDETMTVFQGHHQPLKTWIACLYLMALNLSNSQIAEELDLSTSAVQLMTELLRKEIDRKRELPKLSHEVECDEVYVIAGHKGNPAAVEASGRKARRRRLKGSPGRGTYEKDKPPIQGIVQRSGEVVFVLLKNVKKTTIEPIIQSVVLPGSTVYTDEYIIYDGLQGLNYVHKSVNHGAKEYARDEDGDGFHEVHVNTIEGIWSLLRSWLRPHRGISKEKLPLYLSFFEFVYNARKRGKAALHSLVAALVS